MTHLPIEEWLSEPERYELREPAAWDFDRREFFRIAGCGVVVALLAREQGQAQPPGRRGGGAGARPREISAWLHIGENSRVTVFTGKVEIGQNIRTSLTQVIAEELRTPVEQIELVMADTDRVPDDGGTAGSRTTPDTAVNLRRVAAAARDVLLDLAAEESKLDRANLSVQGGRVVGPNGVVYKFGRLTRGKKLAKEISAASTTPVAKWTIAGTSVPKVDGRAIVTGSHQYASDIRRPGMLFGTVLRPSAFKATLESIDSRDAEAIAGAKIIRDGSFIGTVGPTAQVANEARDALRPKWTTVAQPSAKDLFHHLRNKAGRGGGGGGRGGGGTGGSIETGLASAAHKLKSTYTIAYIAHTPMEPRAAVAEWNDGRVTVWTGTQMPFRVRSEIAGALQVPQDRVRVIVPDMGSGYGGKHTGEVAVEAARLARAVGKPVKLVWSREEEFTWAYFRPAGVIDIQAGVAADGRLTAWEFHNYNSGGSALATPYEVPNRKQEFHSTDSPLRQGSYRALASTANVFARESHMDDLAHMAGLDPLAFRLKNLKEPRLRDVLEAAALRFGWGKSRSTPDRGFGIAYGTEKASFVATCAEVVIDAKKQVRVVRAVSAFECGAVLNPDHLKNQVEGCLVMGLGGALFEQVDFADGQVRNASFADYRVPRFKDAPEIEVVLVNRPDLPSVGAGETPIVGIAPAIGNAIFAATGVRRRSLPLAPDGLT